MNTKPMLIALTLGLGALGAAQAMDHDGPRSREAVRAEARAELLMPTIAKGEGPPMDLAMREPMRAMGEVSRAEVKDEAADAVRSGRVAKGEGPTRVNTQGDGSPSRAEVKAQAAEAVADGAIEKGPSPSPTKTGSTKD